MTDETKVFFCLNYEKYLMPMADAVKLFEAFSAINGIYKKASVRDEASGKYHDALIPANYNDISIQYANPQDVALMMLRYEQSRD